MLLNKDREISNLRKRLGRFASVLIEQVRQVVKSSMQISYTRYAVTADGRVPHVGKNVNQTMFRTKEISGRMRGAFAWILNRYRQLEDMASHRAVARWPKIQLI